MTDKPIDIPSLIAAMREYYGLNTMTFKGVDLIAALEQAQAENTRLREALADLLDRIRCTGLDMGGRHRYQLLGNGGPDLPVVIQRAGDALAATPQAAEPAGQGDSESERAQRWGCNGTPATQQGEQLEARP